MATVPQDTLPSDREKSRTGNRARGVSVDVGGWPPGTDQEPPCPRSGRGRGRGGEDSPICHVRDRVAATQTPAFLQIFTIFAFGPLSGQTGHTGVELFLFGCAPELLRRMSIGEVRVIGDGPVGSPIYGGHS